MMRFSDEFLKEIREKNDIVDVISPYVNLQIRGSTAKGLCPFHNEKTASFTVYINTQSYYCFGCGSGGDAITFIKNAEGLHYSDAVAFLAQKSGIPLPQDGYDDTVAKMKRRMYDANREAAKFFHATLMSPEGKNCLDYFLSRGLTPETIRHFGLGCAPDKWDALIRHMKKKGYSEQEILAADLARKTKNGHVIDTYRNRAMFPIIDVNGSVIAFGGRVLDDSKPKYVNTADTLVYKKSQGVFALNFAKKGTGKTIILCEGYMDVIAYHQAGFENAVAGLGTAFTPEQAKLISRYAEEVILSYDSDEAGQKATRRTIGILSKTPVRIKVARLQGGKDPDEIIKKYGKDKMQQILSSAVGDVDFELTREKQGYDLSSPDGKVAYLGRAVEILSMTNNPIHWDVYASKLSQELGVDKKAIVAQIERKAKQNQRRETKANFDKATTFNDEAMKKANPERQKYLVAAKAEETLISLLLHNPDFYFKIKSKLSEDDFSTSLNCRIFRLLAQKIEQKRPVDVTYFAEELNDEELGYLVRLECMRENLSNTVNECLDCIKRMKEEKIERNTKQASDMTDDEWASMFKKNQ